MAGDSPQGFTLQTSDNDAFAGRSQDVFAGLDNIEAKHDAKQRAQDKFGRTSYGQYMKDDPEEETLVTHQHRRPQVTQPVFRAPRGRAPGRKPSIPPGYKQNPSQWKHYDLSDTTDDQMSDRANTAAAFQFLQERKRHKEEAIAESPSKVGRIETDTRELSHETSMETDDALLLQKPVFVKPLSTDSKTEIAETQSYTQGKYAMPEYVVGKDKRKKPAKAKMQETLPDNDAVAIGHLQEEENDDVEPPVGQSSEGMMPVDSVEKETISFKKNKKSVKQQLRRRTEEEEEED